MGKLKGIIVRARSRRKHLMERTAGKLRNLRSLLFEREYSEALRKHTDFLLRGRKEKRRREKPIGSYFDARFRVLRKTKKRLVEILQEMGAGYCNYSIYSRVKTTDSMLDKIARRMRYFEENLEKVSDEKDAPFVVTRKDIERMIEPGKRGRIAHIVFNEQLFKHIVNSMGYKLPKGYSRRTSLRRRLMSFFKKYPDFKLRVNWRQLLLLASEDVLKEKMGLRVVLRPSLKGFITGELPPNPRFTVLKKVTPIAAKDRERAITAGGRFTHEIVDEKGRKHSFSFARVVVPEGNSYVTTVLLNRATLERIPILRDYFATQGYKDNPTEAFLISKLYELEDKIRQGELALEETDRTSSIGVPLKRTDTVRFPEDRGFRSLNITTRVAREGPPVELQIRTQEMDSYIKLIDKFYGPYAKIKAGKAMSLKERRKYLQFLNELPKIKL